ncbi:macro domain-containing protein [Paraburkholderia sp. BCC1886]|uniref:macro domain-containing protein n=1 Tax=Paraburkholderia sp. BCC1886 TaxID=2562670 RepID=UPI001183A661|nr:macro domain-containing protein [Paraburkholderia sp. BCC1886]
MITHIGPGDLFQSKAQSLVVPVNTVGAMGKGIAKTFALNFPGLLEDYRRACSRGVFSTRGLYVWEGAEDRKIICFPTKRHWRFRSQLPWLDQGLARLARDFEKYGITSIAMPQIGCGEGGLDWINVYPLIVEWLEPLPIPVEIYLSPT